VKAILSVASITGKGGAVGSLITLSFILHSNWASGSRDSRVALHWSFHYSFSRQVTELWRWLSSSLRTSTLGTRHCIRSRFSGVVVVVRFPAGLSC